MADSIALAILWTLATYGLAGLCFALAFVFRGIHCIAPAAEHAGLWFRIILLPGAAALWPILLRRWILAGAKP